MEFKVKDGQIIYYRDLGKGFPIVFLHGNNLSGNYFAKQGILYRDYRLIFIDSRNHGRSSRQSVKMTFEQMTADLEEILQFLNIKKALFVGHSDGANLAMVYASRFPNRIAGLLLNAGNMTFNGLTRRSRFLVHLQYLCLKALSPFSAKMDIMAKVTGLMLHDLPLDREQLHKASYPVWVVMGQRDVISFRHSKEISELFPIHKLYVERRQGHRLAQRKYKVFNQMIRDLVRISRKEVVA